MGISSEGYRRRKQVKLQTDRSSEGETTKDPKGDVGEQQMNGTLYFMNF